MQEPEPEPVTEDGNHRYPSREHRKPKRYGDYVLDESAKYRVITALEYCPLQQNLGPTFWRITI